MVQNCDIPPINRFFPLASLFIEEHIVRRTYKESFFFITGATSGVGFEVATVLYSENTAVYIARSLLIRLTRPLNQFRMLRSALEAAENLNFPR